MKPTDYEARIATLESDLQIAQQEIATLAYVLATVTTWLECRPGHSQQEAHNLDQLALKAREIEVQWYSR